MSDEPEETGPVFYRIGEKDASGRLITDILGRDSNRYGRIVVYLAKELKGNERAYWEFNKEDPDDISPEYLPKITDEFDRLKTLITMSPLPHEHIKLAHVEAGKALINSFRKLTQDKSADHTVFFRAANNYLLRSAEQSSRFIYVGAGLCALIIFFTFGMVIGYFDLLPIEKLKLLFFCSVGGATGAAISMIQRGQNISVNPFSTSNYLCFEGTCRIFLGILFSIVLYVGIHSGIVLSLAKQNPYALVFLSIISGFNERFVKELMKHSEKEMLEE